MKRTLLSLLASGLIALNGIGGDLKQELVNYEGKRNSVYVDSLGVPTIGVGFNLTRADAKSKIEQFGLDYNSVLQGKQSLTDEQIYSLLDKDIETAKLDAERYIGSSFNQLPEEAKDILTDMSFNIGYSRLSGFKKLKTALLNKDYLLAAIEMKNSKWYTQTGKRAKELTDKMATLAKIKP